MKATRWLPLSPLKSTACLLPLLAGGSISAPHATAATVVAPSAFAATEAPEQTVGVLRGENADNTFQWILPASDFATIPLGTPITAIGFRMDVIQPTQDVSAFFAAWNLQLSSSNNPSLALSPVFATNIGADVVTVRSCPLLIPANSFTGGSRPNSFYDIPFTTPYIYNGGELVMTVRHTAHSGPQSLIFNDADGVSFGRGNSVGGEGFTAIAGTPETFHFPVTRFTYVPEPASHVLLAIAWLTSVAVKRKKTSGTLFDVAG